MCFPFTRFLAKFLNRFIQRDPTVSVLHRRCTALLQDGAGAQSAPSGTQQAGADVHGGGKLAAGVQMDPQQHRADSLLTGVQVRESV